VISKARKRENDKIILRSANHTKALWQIIKKESENLKKTNQNISLKLDSKIVTNPQYISDKDSKSKKGSHTWSRNSN
jgi:hypothetical protein